MKTVARVRMREGSHTKDYVWMNELCRLNSGLELDDSVSIEKADTSDAETVVISKPSDCDLDGSGEASIKKSLTGRVLHSDDWFGIDRIDDRFRVLKKAPSGPVKITDSSTVKLRPAPESTVIERVLVDARSNFEKTLSRRENFESMLVQQIQLVAVSIGLFLTVVSVIGTEYPPEIPLLRISSDISFLAVGLLFLISAVYSLYTLKNKVSRTLGPSVSDLDALLFDFDSETEVDVQRVANYQYWFDLNNQQNKRLFRQIANGYILLILGWVLLLLLIYLLLRPPT